MSVEQLEKAIAALSADERARLRVWFEAFMADEWDRQIAQDAQSGKLDRLVAESEKDFRAGRYREL
jgi:hypothetical protein